MEHRDPHPARAAAGEAQGASAEPSEAALDGALSAVEPLRVARRGAAAAFERAYVKMVLEKSGGNITRAAAIADVSRQMIQKLMRKYGL